MIDIQALASAPLPEHEQAAERYEIAADAFFLAFQRLHAALEESGEDELADQLGQAFTRAFDSGSA
jgi:hypothetical protein